MWFGLVKSAEGKAQGFVNDIGSIRITRERLADVWLLGQHYLLQRELRARIFKQAIQAEKERIAAAVNAENEEQWRRRISSGEDDSGASRRPLRIQLPEDTRIPPDWSLDWQPAIPLPWTYSLSLIEEAIKRHITIQTGKRQA